MKRQLNRFSVGISLLLPLLLVSASGAADRLNVLMIAVDDLRPELACYGAEHIHSPNIDRLASEGVRFDRAYCQVAVCGASRASLLSGCRPETTGCWNFRTPLRSKMPDVLTLPQHFKQSGYETAFLGKIYHSASDDASSWTLNVNRWAPAQAGKGKSYVLAENAKPTERKPKGDRRPSDKAGPSNENGGDVPDEMYNDGHNADRAVRVIEQFADHEKPFFFAVGFLKPHLPFNAPAKYWDLYDRSSIEIPARTSVVDGVPYASSNWGELKNYPDIPRDVDYLDDEKTRELIHGYRAAVSYTDAQVGKLLAALDRTGQRDNTIVILWGDHGWYVGDFGEWCKHTNYEIATRVPLIVSAPGVAPDRSSESMAEFVDIFPTLCQMTGLDVPEHCQGKSLTPILADPSAVVKPAAFSQYLKNKPGAGQMRGTSIRTDRFRYTEWRSVKTGELDAIELIDFDTDPGATVNVASDPKYASFLPGLAKWCAESHSGT
ncbi:Choline-sulfatase [Rubripirellula lacrimiformis]|uniref:Choline-sulfatase n=1 Tax=Rubripirellula lacrimiformis TaxID=1930273 RepID=A0A517N3K2_9BACT|nr:sulfatase [Rubripirellula lacrimiformis]QDT01715.1 Choline-sulfatase [Rubripirellula lacrimiformis]